MKKMDSFIDSFSFKYILAICLIIVMPDFFKIISAVFLKPYHVPYYTNIWFDISIGAILTFIVAIKLKYKEEKIAVISFGLALISKSFQNLIGYQLNLILVVAFEFIGTYFFWLAYGNYKQKSAKLNNHRNKTIILRLLVFLLILLLPAILFWFLGNKR